MGPRHQQRLFDRQQHFGALRPMDSSVFQQQQLSSRGFVDSHDGGHEVHEKPLQLKLLLLLQLL